MADANLRALPKVDPHHHLWDLDTNDYPWLTGPMQWRMYGDYSAIRRNYLIDDYLRDSRPHAVVKSVHVQAMWARDDPVGETRWVQSIANEHGFPHGIVAYADLSREDVEQVLAGHCEYPNTRGIRDVLGHTDDPEGNRVDRPDPLTDPAWKRGYAQLAKHELSFDLQLFPRQMERAAALIARHPEVPVIVCHTGFPWDRSQAGRALWRRGMSALAALPHVHAKLSGLAMVMRSWSAPAFGDYIHETIDRFGPERCMFASNVPPDALSKCYDDIYEAFYQWAARYSGPEQRLMFHDTACRVYRL